MATGEKIRDVEFMAQAFAELLDQKQEFPIRVEGARTLPYTALVQESKPDQRVMILKLFRPLPPALAMGARFDLVFAFQGKRYEGQIALQDREGYLRYQFGWPQSLLSTDRRLWKRYLFRPRENIYVTAQDNEIPCHGLMGPITNLSQGGFCFRVDRFLRLEDGLPIRPRANLFEPGKSLSLLRIHGLVKDEDLEARGVIVRVQEGDSEIHLAVQFSGLGEKESAMLTRILAARENQSSRGGRGAGPSPGAKPRAAHEPSAPGELGLADVDPTEEELQEAAPEEGAPAEGGLEAGEAAEGPGETAYVDAESEEAPAGISIDQVPELAGLASLLRLDRRAVRLLLVAGTQEQAVIQARLQAGGYWRIECAASLEAASALFRAARDTPFHLLLVEQEALRKEGLEPVAAAQGLAPQLQAFPGLPVAFITFAPDPQLEVLARPGFGAVALDDPDHARWEAVLDWLLQLKKLDVGAAG